MTKETMPPNQTLALNPSSKLHTQHFGILPKTPALNQTNTQDMNKSQSTLLFIGEAATGSPTESATSSTA